MCPFFIVCDHSQIKVHGARGRTIENGGDMKSAVLFWVRAILPCVLSNVNFALSDEGIPPTLKVFTTTMTQIVLQWEDTYPNTSFYKIQKATDSGFTSNAWSYNIGSNSANFKYKIFSDTSRTPGSKYQFNGYPVNGSLLDKDTIYYYRLWAYVDGNYVESNHVSAQVNSAPVRGQEGDLWADVVFGQPDFASKALAYVSPHSTDGTAGIVIDRTTTPQRVYIMDGRANRILGFNGIPTPESTPALVIGQPNFYSSASNKDSCFQTYPYALPASNDTLGLIPPDIISVGEIWINDKMVLDENHNLYCADNSNHRILKFNDPFAQWAQNGEVVANDLWGQYLFTDRSRNRGGAPADNSFSFGDTVGIAFDVSGNMWVTDNGNRRVLRFPKIDGVIQHAADYVLGQKDFRGNCYVRNALNRRRGEG